MMTTRAIALLHRAVRSYNDSRQDKERITMKARVFIDGEAGTTGLQIRTRLLARDDIELVSLPDELRKDARARADVLNGVDVAILCLPDEAAREAVALVENPDVKIIDASTAHRVADGWTYGFSELNTTQRQRIASAKRVTNPGCYALASISMLYPLVAHGLVPRGAALSLNAISGYSGGGKKLIASFEEAQGADAHTPYFVYGLNLQHKHIPEITHYSDLDHSPAFVPSVGHFAQGMIVQLPLNLWSLPGQPSARDVHETLARHYEMCRYVSVAALDDTAQMSRLQPEDLNGTNDLRLYVFAGEQQAVVMAQLDNLGKGASGSCVQNLNIMLGRDEAEGL